MCTMEELSTAAANYLAAAVEDGNRNWIERAQHYVRNPGALARWVCNCGNE